MATEIKTWEIVEGKLKEINTTLAENDRREREHLEEWIKTNTSIIGEDILIIGEQVQTKNGFVDFLGIDKNGNTVIVELKRDKLAREVIAQSIDYASDVSTWDLNKLSEICLSYLNQDLLDSLSEQFDEFNIEEVVINNNQRLLIVGFGIDEPTSRMVEWLSSNYNMSINAIILRYSKTSNNTEILSRTVVIPEEIEIQKANKKKFTIARSDEPGNYDTEKLKELLKKYLTKNLHSSRRIKDIVLPFLINGNTATRTEILKEFVRTNEAKDERQAGYFMSLISNQLGHEWKDYLRQIIEYNYPNNYWEKDNFRIKKEYINLVKEVLEDLK